MVTTLRLTDLCERHAGLTKAIADSLAEAATVCMHRYHSSPATMKIVMRDSLTECEVGWLRPSEGLMRAYANDTDTTELGAYGVCLAATEMVAGLVAVRRAETTSGADYYVAPVGSSPDDMEACIRLEVSGVGAGNEAVVQARLRQKVQQAAKGRSDLPAMAAVVGFRERLIAIALLGGER